MGDLAKLKKENEDLKKQIQANLADQSLMYTNCLKIAFKNKYKEIIEYLNPDPQDLVNLSDSDNQIIEDKPKIEKQNKSSLMKWVQ